MGKPRYDEIEFLVTDRSPTWQNRLGLDHVEIEHVFLDSFFGDDGEEDFKITAVCETRWNYLEAKIKWFLPSAVRHLPGTLEQVLVHELCHVLLSAEQGIVATMEALATPEAVAAAGVAQEKIELCTEMVARAIWRAWAGR